MIRIYNNNNYYTKYNLLSFNKTKIYLIKWQPKMKTKIHGHPNVNCNYYLLYGDLIEKVYKNNKLINSNKNNKFLDEIYK